MKAISTRGWGGPDVLAIEESAEPHAGPGQVRVRVAAVSLNLADVAISTNEQFAGLMGLTLPLGFANDFAGVIDEVGEGVTAFAVGDRVFGGARARAAAEYVLVTPPTGPLQRGAFVDELYHTPAGVTDLVASTLQTAGTTADAAIGALGLSSDDTVLVGGAAGGVGVYAVQLARLTGARVIGTASPGTFAFLEDLGVEPLAYGEGLTARLLDIAPEGITAAADLHGTEVALTALSFGVDPARISAVAARESEIRDRVTVTGSIDAPIDSMDRIAALVASDDIRVPIAMTLPIDQFAEAVGALLGRHTHGKITLAV